MTRGRLASVGAASLVRDVVALMAGGVWLGGLIVLGAIVAPTVFRNVPAPFSADAMTLVFQKFDRIAIGCAAMLLLTEAARLATPSTSPIDSERARSRSRYASALGWFCLLAAAALAIVEGVLISPAVAALHRAGAVRYVGPDGERLEMFHRWAERDGKAQLALLVVFFGVWVWRARTSSHTIPVSAARSSA